MSRLFGTDGVRGLANGPVITAELALSVSVAAARVLGQAGADPGHRPKAVVGRDPRASGEFLSAAVVAGLASAGVDVYNAGVLPTPAVAYLTRWRMQVAATALREDGAGVAELAGALGYRSEAAFARAFKRVVGVPPGAVRRSGGSGEELERVLALDAG